jgi:hypothetical protein
VSWSEEEALGGHDGGRRAGSMTSTDIELALTQEEARAVVFVTRCCRNMYDLIARAWVLFYHVQFKTSWSSNLVQVE